MTNETALLSVLLSGAQIKPDFQPQNNKQAYLAYLCGLNIPLPEPRTVEETLLYNLCLNGGMGGGTTGVLAQVVDGSIKEITAKDLEGATCIYQMAFSDRHDLESIEIPEGVTTIGASAFYYCNNLTRVVLPESLVNIYASAFAECSSLTSLTIPANVKDIGVQALKIGSEENPATITVLRTTPPSLASTSINQYALAKIIVPKGCGAAYKAASGWSKFADYIVEST